MGTDIPKGLRHGKLLANYGSRRIVVPFFDITEVFRNIGMRRTSCLAGNHVIFLALFGRRQNIPDRSGRANLRAGLAEAAVCVLKQLVLQGSGVDLQILSLLIVKNINAPKNITGAYAPSAENASVHIMKEQWIFRIDRKALGTHFHAPGLRPDILDQYLQLTVSKFRTGRTILRMPCQKQLKRKHAESLDLLILCLDHHPVFRLQHTGRLYLIVSLYLHDTHPTGTERIQVFVMAKVRNVNSRVQCTFQDVFPLRDFNFYSINCDDSHRYILLFKKAMV